MNRGDPRSFAFIVALLLGGAACAAAFAQTPPPPSPSPAPGPTLISPAPVPAPPVAGATPSTTATPSSVAPTAVPAATLTPSIVPAPAPQPIGSLSPAGSPPAVAPDAVTTPGATGAPTPPPIIVEPPSTGVTVGGTQTLRVQGVLGSVSITLSDPSIVDATVDQVQRTVTVTGKKLGATTLTVRDDRGMTRDVAIRVAYPAGSIADSVTVRLTGDPATPFFIQEQVLNAAVRAAQPRAGAQVVAPDSIDIAHPLGVDNIMIVSVPIIVQGDGYFTVQGTTRVRVENVGLPRIHPAYLLVSDFPETLKENGLLFEADISTARAARFLYYHYNPPAQPDRRIVLKLHNASSQPANVQFIFGMAGPGANDMEVGHLSTQRFLVREANNEGTVVTIPAGTTMTLIDQPMPAQNVVSNLVQLREIDGAQLHLTLIAQNASDAIDGPVQDSKLLIGDRRHARGVYPIPEFFFDYQYDTSGPDLEVPIGQIPVPELKQGEALSGDYGVLQSLTVRIVNPDPHNAASIAVYANPRGGRATGTFIIDGVLLQAHALAPFGHYKLREYTVPPGGFIRTTIATMPEGGSSYPLRLVIATDDGSASPGAPNSFIY